MSSASEIVRLRRQRQDQPSGKAGRWIGAGCSLLLALLVALTGLGLAALYTALTAGLPAVEILPALLDPQQGLLLQPSRIYDRSGTQVIATLDNVPEWTEHVMEPPMRALTEELGLKTGQLFGIVRIAVTGKEVAPPLFGTMVVLGRDKVMQRLRAAEKQLASAA